MTIAAGTTLHVVDYTPTTFNASGCNEIFDSANAWSNSTTYAKNTSVTYDSKKYISNDIASNLNKAPDTETSYWTLIGDVPLLVGEITDIGEFGREYSLVTHNPIGSRGTKKLKGGYNAGSLQLTLAFDTSDDGQLLMKSLRNDDANGTFMITLENGDKYYLLARVMYWKIGVGSVNSIITAKTSLEVEESVTVLNS